MNRRDRKRHQASSNFFVQGSVKFLEGLDIFSADLPSLNIRGKSSVKTSVGGFMTLLIFLLVLMFSIMKYQLLLMRKNPQITSNTEENAFPVDHKLNLIDTGFAMAFGLDHFTEGVKNDPRYVKWVA